MTGLYRCRAENEAGVDKYDVLLLVMSCDHQSGDVTFHAQGKVCIKLIQLNLTVLQWLQSHLGY